MLAVIFSAVVCPGAGQIYNRQRLKGVALILASAGASVAVAVLVVRNVLQALPADVLTIGPAEMQTIMQKAHSGTLVTLGTAVLAVTWIVSVVDAYLVARRSAAPPPDAPATTISR
jgi:TM2 domain-containing membrane protein YozV